MEWQYLANRKSSLYSPTLSSGTQQENDSTCISITSIQRRCALLWTSSNLIKWNWF